MFICEIWLFDWYFTQFCTSDMSKYGYLEVFQRVPSTSSLRELTVLLKNGICCPGSRIHSPREATVREKNLISKRKKNPLIIALFKKKCKYFCGIFISAGYNKYLLWMYGVDRKICHEGH